MLRFCYQASCRVKYSLTRCAHTQISSVDATAKPITPSVHELMNLGFTESWISKQNRNNRSTNKIKNNLSLPLHSHLHLFHSLESQGLDITKLQGYRPLPQKTTTPESSCLLPAGKSLQTVSAKLPAQSYYQCYGLAWPSLWYTHSMEARGAAEKLPGFDHK